MQHFYVSAYFCVDQFKALNSPLCLFSADSGGFALLSECCLLSPFRRQRPYTAPPSFLSRSRYRGCDIYVLSTGRNAKLRHSCGVDVHANNRTDSQSFLILTTFSALIEITEFKCHYRTYEVEIDTMWVFIPVCP